ncbi:DMT family transporter [Ferroplasma sp.]|uniref:DMT family transporter n=1 Tax=Ferroplasma sp. TaxID=2591003 RepID=UPI00307ECCCE
MGKQADILLFAVMVVSWAINYPVIKIALKYTNAYTLLFYRIFFSVIFIYIIFKPKLHLKISRHDILLLFILSLLDVVIWMELWFVAETTISASLSSILIYTYPIISTLMAVIFLGEHHNKYVFAGIAFGFTGILIIFSNSLLTGFKPGIVIALLSAIMWSVGTMYFMKYHSKRDRETTNFLQFAFATIPVFIIAVIAKPSISIFEPSLVLVGLVLVMAIPGTAVAYYAFLHLNKKYGVSTISSFLFIVPALSVVFSLVILNEIPSNLEIAGLVLVGTGIFFSARGTKNVTLNKTHDKKSLS